jgi:hypothetical protein
MEQTKTIVELQNKFEEIHQKVMFFNQDKLSELAIESAKQCTIFCLEEQIKLLAKCGSNSGDINYIDNYIDKVQKQLKLLKDEN